VETFCRQIGSKPETDAKAFGIGGSPVMQVIESVAESLDLASGFDEQKVAAELASLDALWDSHADTGES
jgi:hypothetical protein